MLAFLAFLFLSRSFQGGQSHIQPTGLPPCVTSLRHHDMRREFISPVLALALLVARTITSCGSDVVLTPEYQLDGKLAWGPIDYVVLYKELAIVVVEVRKQGFRYRNSLGTASRDAGFGMFWGVWDKSCASIIPALCGVSQGVPGCAEALNNRTVRHRI